CAPRRPGPARARAGGSSRRGRAAVKRRSGAARRSALEADRHLSRPDLVLAQQDDVGGRLAVVAQLGAETGARQAEGEAVDAPEGVEVERDRLVTRAEVDPVVVGVGALQAEVVDGDEVVVAVAGGPHEAAEVVLWPRAGGAQVDSVVVVPEVVSEL